MEQEVVYEGRKAGIAYFGVVVMVILAVVVVLFISEVQSSGSSQMPMWFPVAVGIILVLGFLKWRSVASVRWVVTENSLIIKRGFLPWTRSTFTFGSGIHDVRWSKGFFQHLFGYGRITISSTHGTTEYTSEWHIKKPEDLGQAILDMLSRRKADGTEAATGSQRSAIDELKDLTDLREKGAVSQEEFERMKAKILEQ